MEDQKFAFENTEFEGLKLIHPFMAYDSRGFFMKTYERRIFEENGIYLGNAEDFICASRKGVIRGLHFFTEHSQDKLINVLSGEVWDVVVDLRKGSDTFARWKGFYLSEENRLSVYVPEGFAHGYIALSDDVLFSYRCGQPYLPNHDSGIRWDDKDLDIKWPLERVGEIIVSEKDKKLQSFAEFCGKVKGL